MKISINWIQEHCPFDVRETPREIGVRFTLSTAEVEDARAWGEGLDRIVVARILDVRPHPKADNLRIARIDPGAALGGVREVVCGAPNARAGLTTPYAPPGAIVGGKEVRTAAIRGVESPGMLLSQAELGVSDESGAIWELPADAAPGTPLCELYPELVDVILEVDNKSLTHRPDLWGHYGIAREFSVIYGVPLRPLSVREDLARQSGDAGIRVVVDPEPRKDAPPRCPRYCGLRIDGVRVAPSPPWLRHRLLAVGSRPINNVVDVTNYVMFELGQPLHAFDTARIRGGQIRVRRAAPGEVLRVLDGTEAHLAPEDLVIADGAGPVALAGVIGGETSGVGDGTTSIFLESANFEPAGVRRTALRTVRTESSARFEKSLDAQAARTAILRAAALVLDLCPGAKVVGMLQDVAAPPRPPIVISVSPASIAQRLGTAIGPERIASILEGLGFGIDGKAPGGAAIGGAAQAPWKVRVPSWRATRDISIPEDLIEEVGRLHGFGAIEPFAPIWPVAAPAVNERRLLERRLKEFLTLHGGLTEVFTYSMVGAAHCRLFGLDPEACLKLKNPMSEELDRMRREIVPIHLEKARENQRYFQRFGFFELGRVYLKNPEPPTEGLFCRDKIAEFPSEKSRIAGLLRFESKSDANFYEARHIALALLERAGAAEWKIEPIEADRRWIHPQAGARILQGGKELARFYRIHPEIEEKLELKGDTLAFDVDFDALAELQAREEKYRRLPRFPFVTFDVAVEAPERTPAAEIEAVIRRGAGEALRRLEAFDVYRGPNLPPGVKSIAFHVEVGAGDHTLAGSEAESHRDAVIRALGDAGFKLRG